MNRLKIHRLKTVLVTLAAAALLLAFALTTNAQFFSSSSGSCVPPATAASIIALQYEYIFADSNLSADPKVCEKACHKAKRACRTAVVAAKRCLDKFAKKQDGVFATSCESENFQAWAGSDSVGDCRDDSNSLKQDEKDFSEDSRDTGEDLCGSYRDSCVEQCGDVSSETSATESDALPD